jgi:hypothetical protein
MDKITDTVIWAPKTNFMACDGPQSQHAFYHITTTIIKMRLQSLFF